MYIGCASCHQWFHPQELELSLEETQAAKQAEHWHCPDCTAATYWGEEWAEDQLFCICEQPYDELCYLNCISCEGWFHPQCVGMSEAEELELDWELWRCPRCESADRPAKRQLLDLDDGNAPSKRQRGGGKGGK